MFNENGLIKTTIFETTITKFQFGVFFELQGVPQNMTCW